MDKLRQQYDALVISHKSQLESKDKEIISLRQLIKEVAVKDKLYESV